MLLFLALASCNVSCSCFLSRTAHKRWYTNDYKKLMNGEDENNLHLLANQIP